MWIFFQQIIFKSKKTRSISGCPRFFSGLQWRCKTLAPSNKCLTSSSFYIWKLFLILFTCGNFSLSFCIWKLFLLLFTSGNFFFFFLHLKTFSLSFYIYGSTFREKRIEENRNIIIKKLFDEELCSKLLCMTSRRKKIKNNFHRPSTISPFPQTFSPPQKILSTPKSLIHTLNGCVTCMHIRWGKTTEAINISLWTSRMTDVFNDMCQTLIYEKQMIRETYLSISLNHNLTPSSLCSRTPPSTYHS